MMRIELKGTNVQRTRILANGKEIGYVDYDHSKIVITSKEAKEYLDYEENAEQLISALADYDVDNYCCDAEQVYGLYKSFSLVFDIDEEEEDD